MHCPSIVLYAILTLSFGLLAPATPVAGDSAPRSTQVVVSPSQGPEEPAHEENHPPEHMTMSRLKSLY